MLERRGKPKERKSVSRQLAGEQTALDSVGMEAESEEFSGSGSVSMEAESEEFSGSGSVTDIS